MPAPPQTAWPSETPWRQGAVLPPQVAYRLGLVHEPYPHETCVVVISHDCDLAHTDLAIEPDVEVIVGHTVGMPNGNYTYGKSPRTLHWEISKAGALVTIELVATAKQTLRKERLADCLPDPDYAFTPAQLHVVRTWLSFRYNRAAFPDEFERRLRNAKLDRKFDAIMKRHGLSISAIYFDVDRGYEIDRSDGSAYELAIVLTYPEGESPETALEAADAAAEQLLHLFEITYYDEHSALWRGIQLIGCNAIAEEDITVARAKLMTRRPLDHLSLRDNNDSPAPRR